MPGHITQCVRRRRARFFALGFFRRLRPLFRNGQRLAIAAFVVEGGSALLKGLDLVCRSSLGRKPGPATPEKPRSARPKAQAPFLAASPTSPRSNRGERYLLCWVKVRRRGGARLVSLAVIVEPASGASSVREFRCWWRETSPCDVRNGSSWPTAPVKRASRDRPLQNSKAAVLRVAGFEVSQVRKRPCMGLFSSSSQFWLLFFLPLFTASMDFRDNRRGNPPSRRGAWPRYSLVSGSL